MALIYRIFIKGVLTLLPIGLTIYLLVWLATQAENVFGSPLRIWFPGVFGFTGAGFIVGMTVVFAVGLAVNNYVTRRFLRWFEVRLESLPVVSTIYAPLRDVTNLFASQSSGSSGQKVVMVQTDDHGTEVLGLITRDSFDDLPSGSIPSQSVAVFVPFSYGMGGLTWIVPKSRLRETAIPAERAMQLAITGWIKSSSKS